MTKTAVYKPINIASLIKFDMAIRHATDKNTPYITQFKSTQIGI